MSLYQTKRDQYAAEGIAIYKKSVPTANFVIVEYTNNSYEYNDENLNMAINFYKNKKSAKFRPISLTPVSSTLFCFAFSVQLHPRNKNAIAFKDRTGTFKLEFSDGSIFILMKYLSGSSANQVITSLMIGEEDTFRKILTFSKIYKKISGKPKNGIFTIKALGDGRIVYEKLKKIQHTPVIHPSVESVTIDLDNYFENVSEFTKYGMSGVRKVLLVGPPGTGKSSYAYRIASRHKSSKSVVFASDINTVAYHLSRCSKGNIPTIIIWEDAESTGLRNAGSSILNFLDGIDQPVTKCGAYIIMTTNFPEMIDSRIKKRPGRIDRIFEFGVLKGTFALKCAQIYFYDLFKYKFSDQSEEARAHFARLMSITTGMSGAAIKSLAYSSKLYAAGHKLPVTLDLVNIVKKDLNEDLLKVDSYAKSEPEKRIGFKEEVELVSQIDWETMAEEQHPTNGTLSAVKNYHESKRIK